MRGFSTGYGIIAENIPATFTEVEVARNFTTLRRNDRNPFSGEA